MKETYDASITDPSLKELEEFSRWYNEKIGNYPVIVGGWAVYCYTKGLGSKDIDVVFLSDETKHITLFAYFLSHGYIERRRSFFDKEFVKLIKVGEQEIEIIIDAVSSNRIITFDGRNARLPWSWAIKHSKQHKIGNSIIYIPIIEVLLVYKLGAILGRNLYLKTGIDFEYYRSKIWKDVYDVLSLCNLKIDKKKVNLFMKEAALDQYKEEILQIIKDNFDDETKLLLRNVTLEQITSILDKGLSS